MTGAAPAGVITLMIKDRKALLLDLMHSTDQPLWIDVLTGESV
jgi:hypothetical protein